MLIKINLLFEINQDEWFIQSIILSSSSRWIAIFLNLDHLFEYDAHGYFDVPLPTNISNIKYDIFNALADFSTFFSIIK